MSKTVEHYLSLPYAVSFLVDEDGDIVAKVRELPGCSAHGKTMEEAYANIKEAMSLWIEDALERDDTIPVPFVDRSEGMLDNFKRLYLSPDRVLGDYWKGIAAYMQRLGPRPEDGDSADPELPNLDSFPVTDPDLDAPDGAIVDGYNRVGDTWFRNRKN